MDPDSFDRREMAVIQALQQSGLAARSEVLGTVTRNGRTFMKFRPGYGPGNPGFSDSDIDNDSDYDFKKSKATTYINSFTEEQAHSELARLAGVTETREEAAQVAAERARERARWNAIEAGQPFEDYNEEQDYSDGSDDYDSEEDGPEDEQEHISPTEITIVDGVKPHHQLPSTAP